MKQFKDFGIKRSQVLEFIGDKISMTKVLNKPITIEHYRIVDSKFTEKGSGKRLDLQIIINDNKRVIFTGASVLMETIEKVPKDSFPFITTIVEENERYEFT